jgi:TolB protein
VSPVTDGRGRDVIEWSTDGASLLVFSEDETRTAARHLGDLSVIEVDGGETRLLNPDGTSVSAIIRFGTAASFSPDGTRVAFAARQTDQPDETALFVAPVAGGAPRQVTDWGPGTTTALWSPDGESILFDHDGVGGPSISLVQPDGAGRRDVWTSDADGFGCCGTWSPDGARILFQRGSGDARELWVMDADGQIEGRAEVDMAQWIWYRWTPQPGRSG